jgi:plastocyanin
MTDDLKIMTTPRSQRRGWPLALAAALLPLAACADNGAAEPVRSYTLRLSADDSQEEYTYIADDPVDIRVGDEVTFEFNNTGELIHDLQVMDPEGDEIGLAEPVGSGGTTSVTVLFEEPGYYRLNCLVDDHLTLHSMQSIVEVTEA